MTNHINSQLYKTFSCTKGDIAQCVTSHITQIEEQIVVGGELWVYWRPDETSADSVSVKPEPQNNVWRTTLLQLSCSLKNMITPVFMQAVTKSYMWSGFYWDYYYLPIQLCYSASSFICFHFLSWRQLTIDTIKKLYWKPFSLNVFCIQNNVDIVFMKLNLINLSCFCLWSVQY